MRKNYVRSSDFLCVGLQRLFWLVAGKIGGQHEDKMRPLSPLKAIHAHCRQCMGGNGKLIRSCTDTNCPLYPYRLGQIPEGADRHLLRIIRAFCIQCAGSSREADTCGAGRSYRGLEPCPLHRFRRGANPNIGIDQRHRLGEAARARGFLTRKKESFAMP
jgi:hypothetical protein